MILNKRKYLIIFILFVIYFLFFNMFNMKVNALVNQMGKIEYYYYKWGNQNNNTRFSVSNDNVTTISLFDLNFYTTSDNVTEENYFHEMTNRAPSGTTYPAQYLSFIFYTLEDATILNPTFTVLNGEYNMEYCNILDTIENNGINFYINTCSYPEAVNIIDVAAQFNTTNPVQYNSNHFAFSDLYTFNNESDLIEFITRKQAEINQTIEDNNINQVVDNIYQFISNDNIDSSGGGATISFYENQLPSDNSITNLLTLPITLLNAVVNGIQTVCTSFNLGNLFGHDIIFPCLNLQQYLGTALWSTIDFLMCGFMIYNIVMKLISIFLRFTSLDTSIVDELYVHNATRKY